MTIKSISYAVAMIAALTTAHQASAQSAVGPLLPYPSGHIGYASVERDIIQDVGGRNSSTETLIGSVRAPSGARMATASAVIRGSATIRNHADNSLVTTKVGSIDSNDFFSGSGSKSANLSANAEIERDLRIENMGRNNVMTTEIGSVSDADAGASATARVRGSVEHRVMGGENSYSTLSVGSVASGPRFIALPGPSPR